MNEKPRTTTNSQLPTTIYAASIRFLQGLKAPSEYLAAYFPDKEAPTERVCTSCAHVGMPNRQMAGRADIEQALWAVLVVLAFIYVCDFITIRFTEFFLFRWLYKLTSMAGKVFAVLSMAYTLIRISIHNITCPKCGSSNIIPLDTPKAKEIIAAHPPRG